MKILFIITLSLLLFSCGKQLNFTKSAWANEDDGFYTKRKYMLDDLLENYKIIGSSSAEIVTLLGKPEYHEKNSLLYTIDITYSGIDPSWVKYLEIVQSTDSIIVEYKITEMEL